MFGVDSPSRSGGQSIGGFEQVVASSAGRWRATMTFDIFRGGSNDAKRLLYWRWFLAHMQGRSNSIVIGPFDEGNTPAALNGETAPSPLPHDDDTYFDDGTGYAQTLVSAHTGNAALGDTSVLVNVLSGHQPQPGQYFSVNNRMHMIRSAALYEPLLEGFVPAYWTLGIWPPVREDWEDGTWAEFDNPVCIMRLASDNSGDLPLKTTYIGEATIELVESPVE